MKLTKGTFILDLEKTEDELLNSISRRIKRAINEAKTHSFVCEESQDRESAYDVYVTACKYLHLKPESRKTIFGDDFKLIVAKSNNKIVSMFTVELKNDVGREVFTGTLPEFRDTQVISLLRWFIILYCKSKGMKKYDLGGFDPLSKDPKVIAVNQNKISWGGKEVLHDVEVSNFAWIYYKLNQTSFFRFFKKIYNHFK